MIDWRVDERITSVKGVILSADERVVDIRKVNDKVASSTPYDLGREVLKKEEIHQ